VCCLSRFNVGMMSEVEQFVVAGFSLQEVVFALRHPTGRFVSGMDEQQKTEQRTNDLLDKLRKAVIELGLTWRMGRFEV
jgi:hypothetical protein